MQTSFISRLNDNCRSTFTAWLLWRQQKKFYYQQQISSVIKQSRVSPVNLRIFAMLICIYFRTHFLRYLEDFTCVLVSFEFLLLHIFSKSSTPFYEMSVIVFNSENFRFHLMVTQYQIQFPLQMAEFFLQRMRICLNQIIRFLILAFMLFLFFQSRVKKY